MKRWAWFALILIALVFYKVTWRLVLPFALAFPIAVALNPLVSWLVRRTPLRRTAATVVVFSFVAFLGSAAALLATAALMQGLDSFVAGLPAYQATLSKATDNAVTQLANFILKVPPDVVEAARNNVDQVLQRGQELLDYIGTSMVASLAALPGWASIMIIGVLAAFFFTKDWEWFVRSIFNLLPPEWREAVSKTSSNVGASLGRYVLAQGILILISTLISVAGLAIIGVNRWLAAGLVVGVLDLAPVLGPTLLYVPWAIYAFAAGQTTFAISLLVLFALVSGIRQVLEPKVMGQSLGVHPLLMLASLYWGIVLMGAKGLILAPLTVIVIKAYLEAKADANHNF